ncbi:FtsW/RodA/SpoVE family cell cycle protein [Planctomicrobium sp. SH661]|uniref:FtsW/RodA/SpoVE family cell cycle protein n=1 Tax=Planctomicrobium sp. SH661 TaxID=3448124 RepID=UPI003F5BE833
MNPSSPTLSGTTLELRDDDLQAGLFLTFAGMLLAIGMLMVYSSSFTSVPSEEEQTFLTRQMIFLLLAGLGGIGASRVPAGVWKTVAPLLYAGTVCMLILVLIPGIGRSVNGAQRWFRLGPMSLQPSETAKLTLPLILCTLISRQRLQQRWSLTNLITFCGLSLIPMGLIVVEPDLGTAIFVGLTALLALWLSGCPVKYFIMTLLPACPLGLMFFALKPYQLARLRGFVDTWIHPEEAPYQIQQSLVTLGVGGISGVGLGQGWQKLSFLPEANTDFVMAVIGEELGLVGTLGVLGLWTGIYLTGLKLVRRVPNGSFERALAMTLLTALVVQAVVNMAVITALVPPKGISHPFISYGGSNLGLSIFCLGMIVSLTRLPDTRPDQRLRPKSF